MAPRLVDSTMSDDATAFDPFNGSDTDDIDNGNRRDNSEGFDGSFHFDDANFAPTGSSSNNSPHVSKPTKVTGKHRKSSSGTMSRSSKEKDGLSSSKGSAHSDKRARRASRQRREREKNGNSEPMDGSGDRKRERMSGSSSRLMNGSSRQVMNGSTSRMEDSTSRMGDSSRMMLMDDGSSGPRIRRQGTRERSTPKPKDPASFPKNSRRSSAHSRSSVRARRPSISNSDRGEQRERHRDRERTSKPPTTKPPSTRARTRRSVMGDESGRSRGDRSPRISMGDNSNTSDTPLSPSSAGTSRRRRVSAGNPSPGGGRRRSSVENPLTPGGRRRKTVETPLSPSGATRRPTSNPLSPGAGGRRTSTRPMSGASDARSRIRKEAAMKKEKEIKDAEDAKLARKKAREAKHKKQQELENQSVDMLGNKLAKLEAMSGSEGGLPVASDAKSTASQRRRLVDDLGDSSHTSGTGPGGGTRNSGANQQRRRRRQTHLSHNILVRNLNQMTTPQNADEETDGFDSDDDPEDLGEWAQDDPIPDATDMDDSSKNQAWKRRRERQRQSLTSSS